jgi:hypothetical protein
LVSIRLVTKFDAGGNPRLCEKAVTFLIKKMEETDEKNRTLRKRRTNRLLGVKQGQRLL